MIPLRDRIADLLAHHPAFNLKDDGYSAEDVLRMADAVILALGLRQEHVELLTRHVTQWEPKTQYCLRCGTAHPHTTTCLRDAK